MNKNIILIGGGVIFKKVLLATDFSRCAEQLWNCIDELRELGTEEFVLVHVVPVMSGGHFQKMAKEKLNERKEELEARGLRAKVSVRAGLASHEINEMAQEEQVDLVLAGAKGDSVIREVFLGNTVWDLIRTAKTPVLVEKFKRDEDCSLVCVRKFRRVLLPTDFSEASMRVYSLLKDKLAAFVSEAVLVYVVDRGNSEEIINKNKAEARDRLIALQRNLEDVGVNTSIEIRVGLPAHYISLIAEESGASLIMLATRGAGSITELVLGSTAENVARGAPVPVLLFPVKR